MEDGFLADVDEDLAFALYLQEQFDKEHTSPLLEVDKAGSSCISDSTKPTSIVDPSWELIDPIPDIRQLFLQFNEEYFDGLLAGVEVRWSPRMTLCAGLCCYEGRGGLCSIRLSGPLLKLRPRKDLVETLLHEMIHALLFVTQNNKDHDGHGPEFLKHMHRINKQTGTNISVYHNFHDEVNSYRQHWWKCDGPCQKRPPYFGVLRRAMNRAPSPRDPWWGDHQRFCGGTYHKIKEPENYGKKGSKAKSVDTKGEIKEKRFKKGKNISTLDKFLDKRKRESDGSGEEDSVSENESKRVKSADESHDLVSVLPFSGSGHMLGSWSTSQNEEKNGMDAQVGMDPHIGGEQLLHKTTLGGEAQLKDDGSESGSASRETNSCLKTVREKWLAKWEKEKLLTSGERNKPKGKGEGVNSSKTATPSDSSSTLHRRRELNQNRDETSQHDELNKNGPSTDKIVSPKNSCKTSPKCMTLEEAFRNVTKEKVAPNIKSSVLLSPAVGSIDRPIELGDSPFAIATVGVGSTHTNVAKESPLKMDLPGESSSSVVSCPVCKVLILESQINGHLDQCLL